MKIPRDISGDELIAALIRIGYKITRQKGSHVRLTLAINSEEHHITIPNHDPIKIGTLNNILKDLAAHLNLTKEEIIRKLFL